jgi:small nuclear ribonucleoprotein (snRNP)-like protein
MKFIELCKQFEGREVYVDLANGHSQRGTLKQSNDDYITLLLGEDLNLNLADPVTNR